MNVNLLHAAVMPILSATDENGEDVTIKASEAMAIGKALECASKAAAINANRVLKIKQEAAKETAAKAAKAVTELGKEKGWSPELLDLVRSKVLKVA